MSSKLYPALEQTEDGDIVLDDKELQKMFYDERYNLMNRRRDELSENIRRYMKNKRYFTLANNIQKITSLVLTSSLTIATIIFTSGLAVPFFLIPTASGMSLFFLGFTSSIDKVLKSKKSHLRDKINDQQKLLAKVELFIEKAREDGIITPDEVSRFNKLTDTKKKIPKTQEVDIETLIEQIINRMSSTSNSFPRQ